MYEALRLKLLALRLQLLVYEASSLKLLASRLQLLVYEALLCEALIKP